MDFVPMPEEMRRAMEEAASRHEMQADDYRHSVQRMLDELTEEQASTFRNILHNLGMAGSQLATYYEGQVSQVLYMKYNICPGCGIDHDKQAAEELANPVQSLVEEVQRGTVLIFTDEQVEQMHEYNLDDAYEDGTNKFLGYVCKGCGAIYTSIEDRMLRPPGVEGCSGCIQKQKWG